MLQRVPKVPKLALLILGLLGLGVTVVMGLVVIFVGSTWFGLPINVFGVAEGPDQPIAFAHTTHVQQLGLDCTFCHRTVTEEKAAGIPPVEQCMFCHRIVGEGLPEVEKLRDFFERGDPIDWVRVHRLPDHVRFVHEAHITFFTQDENISASQVCSICHGDVASMTKVKQVRSLKMGDCVDCHRNVTRAVKGTVLQGTIGSNVSAPTDCTTCHY